MKSSIRKKLHEKPYRDAFVASQIRISIPFQIRSLRKQRGWTQAQLAEKAGMLQSRISAMERPGRSKFSLETLLRLASAFDVAFAGRFVPFGTLVECAENFSPDTFKVLSFSEEISLQEKGVRIASGEISGYLQEKVAGKDRSQSENPQPILSLLKGNNVIQFPSNRTPNDVERKPYATLSSLSREADSIYRHLRMEPAKQGSVA